MKDIQLLYGPIVVFALFENSVKCGAIGRFRLSGLHLCVRSS